MLQVVIEPPLKKKEKKKEKVALKKGKNDIFPEKAQFAKFWPKCCPFSPQN